MKKKDMLNKKYQKQKNTSVAEKQKPDVLIRRNAELMKQVSELTMQISEKSQDLEICLSQLHEIKSSTAWKLIHWLWKVKLKVIPRRSSRENLVRKIQNVFKSRPATTEFSRENQKPQQPVVSIVIPVYNALVYTRQCLESLDSAKTSIPVEIILVNNGSSDNTKSWFESYSKNHPNVHMIPLETNLGFGAGVNIGIRQSVGEYIVVLNNDTIVTQNWLENMLSVFKKDEEIGIVSPVTNYTGKGAQLDLDAKNLSPKDVNKYAASIQNRVDFIYEPHRLAFFCVMISRKTVEAIGLFDERYGVGNFEDYDYCFRAIMAGFRLAIARNSFVYHRGFATFKANQIWHAKYMEENQIKYFSRIDEISSTILRKTSRNQKDIPVETSIVLRASNRPIKLQRALMSLANQTYQNFEVVIISEDDLAISNTIESFKWHLNIIFVGRVADQQRVRLLNQAIKQSKGKWVGYLDDDDFLYPWHLEYLLNGLRNNSEYKFAYSNFNRALMNSEIEAIPIKIINGEIVELSQDEIFVGSKIPNHCWLYEKDYLAQAGYFDESLGLLEEYDFLLKHINSAKILHIDRITSESRVYMNDGNELFYDSEALTSLRKIYSRYPQKNQAIVEKRQVELQRMESLSKSDFLE